MKILRFAILLALAFPAAALAEDATIVSRNVPLAGERALASSKPPARFNLVGLHWRGPGSVQFRTRSLGGRWSAWEVADPEAEDQPDSGTPERARSGSWRLGNPWWVGPSEPNRVPPSRQGDEAARILRLEPGLRESPAVRFRSPVRPRSCRGAAGTRTRRSGAPDLRSRPPCASRSCTTPPGRTGTPRPSRRRSSAAIQLYHVKGNGWNDIGYNFLVDRFGQVFEGRYGGIERNVVGAHAEGFNTGSVGVALLGEYSSLAVAQKARDALAALLAWRLDIAHVDPASTLSFLSGGNARFPAGLPVFLRTVSGHRDTGFTDCPGNVLYGLLNQLAGDASRIGLPKLYSPVVTGTVPGVVRFKARLSSALPWIVDVYDSVGNAVGSSAGIGQNVDWTWDATLLPPGSYSYSIRSEESLTPAVGPLGNGEAALSISGLAADPETVSPNDDEVADETTITYTLTSAANVTVKVRDELGTEVATIANKTWKRAGEHAVRFSPAALPDGIFQIELFVNGTGGRQATASTQLAVSRTLGGVRAARLAFSPNADGRADRIAFRFELTGSAEVRLRILKEGKWIATPFKGPLDPGVRRVEWDGAKRVGRLLDGTYEAVVEATDAITTSTVAVPFMADTRQPTIKIVQRYPLRVWVSEPARLTLRFGTRSLVYEALAAGEARVTNAPRLGIVRAVAWDAAGNTSIPASKR